MKKVETCFDGIQKDVLTYYANRQGQERCVTAKDNGEIATKCDREIEGIIKNHIRKHFLDHNILGEESGLSSGKSEYTWYIDPIDNTVGFVAGESEFSTSISLKKGDDYVQSMIINPITNEIFTATENEAYKNNNPLKTFKGNLEGKTRAISTCAYINPVNAKRVQGVFNALFANKYPLRISGGAALDLCRVAEGVRAAHVSLGAHLWDIEAGLHMVKNAGGIVEILTEYSERKSIAFLASANQTIHDSLKSLLGDRIKF